MSSLSAVIFVYVSNAVNLSANDSSILIGRISKQEFNKKNKKNTRTVSDLTE
jgi:hypothetical protein